MPMTRIRLWTLGMFTLLCVALLLYVPRAAHAAEGYGNCKGFISSIPAVISTPGTWCVNQDLTTTNSGGTSTS